VAAPSAAAVVGAVTGHVELLVEGEIPAELEAKARQAVATCPESALSISE